MRAPEDVIELFAAVKLVGFGAKWGSDDLGVAISASAVQLCMTWSHTGVDYCRLC